MRDLKVIAKEFAALYEDDEWAIADLLASEFTAEDYGEEGDSTNTGLHEQLEKFSVVLEHEWRIYLKASTLRHERATGIAWPPVHRCTGATYAAHRLMRGPDRFERMARYVKKNGGKRLGKYDVARYTADEQPPKAAPQVPFDVQARRKIEQTVKGLILGGTKATQEDWWLMAAANREGYGNKGDPGWRRRTVATALRSIAAQIAP